MKKLLFMSLIMMITFTVQSQVHNFGVSPGITVYHQDNIKNEETGLHKLPSLELRYVQDMSPYRGDGHRLVAYTRILGQYNRSEDFSYYGFQFGFQFDVNAIPIVNKDDFDLGFYVSIGAEYDTYWESLDFIPAIGFYTKYKNFAVEVWGKTGLIESTRFSVIPKAELRILYYLIND